MPFFNVVTPKECSHTLRANANASANQLLYFTRITTSLIHHDEVRDCHFERQAHLGFLLLRVFYVLPQSPTLKRMIGVVITAMDCLPDTVIKSTPGPGRARVTGVIIHWLKA